MDMEFNKLSAEKSSTEIQMEEILKHLNQMNNLYPEAFENIVENLFLREISVIGTELETLFDDLCDEMQNLGWDIATPDFGVNKEHKDDRALFSSDVQTAWKHIEGEKQLEKMEEKLTWYRTHGAESIKNVLEKTAQSHGIRTLEELLSAQYAIQKLKQDDHELKVEGIKEEKEENILNFDKTLAKQSEKVRTLLEPLVSFLLDKGKEALHASFKTLVKLGGNLIPFESLYLSNTTGQEFYEDLSRTLKSKELASLNIQNAGIAGFEMQILRKDSTGKTIYEREVVLLNEREEKQGQKTIEEMDQENFDFAYNGDIARVKTEATSLPKPPTLPPTVPTVSSDAQNKFYMNFEVDENTADIIADAQKELQKEPREKGTMMILSAHKYDPYRGPIIAINETHAIQKTGSRIGVLHSLSDIPELPRLLKEHGFGKTDEIIITHRPIGPKPQIDLFPKPYNPPCLSAGNTGLENISEETKKSLKFGQAIVYHPENDKTPVVGNFVGIDNDKNSIILKVKTQNLSFALHKGHIESLPEEILQEREKDVSEHAHEHSMDIERD
jgi:hypothetical protein